jgi:hypothetical protein
MFEPVRHQERSAFATSGINLAGNLTSANARSVAALTANQIADIILQALFRTRFCLRLTVEESCAIDEGIRRIHQYEFLLTNVIPDLRRRLRNLEASTAPACETCELNSSPP